MRVLYYRLIDRSKLIQVHDNCDYQVDCLFHGMRSLLGEDCVDYDKLVHMYDWFTPKEKLYGLGFSLFARLPDIEVDRDDLYGKLCRGYFDLVVIAVHNNMFTFHRDKIAGRCNELISMGPQSKFIVVDGNDSNDIRPYEGINCPVFKRELTVDRKGVHPISFAIPKELVVDEIPEKTKAVSSNMPCQGGFSGWNITNEDEYHAEYRRSKFAHNWKKGGWQTMRVFEIMAGACIPLFSGLENCPKNTHTTLPKKELIDVRDRAFTLSEEEYLDKANFFLDYTKKNLTTESLAKYVLGFI